MIVAFDIDDTLLKEREFCLSGFAAVARACEPWLYPQEVVGVMSDALEKRENHYDALERLAEKKGVSDKIDLKKMVEVCRCHFPRFSVKTMERAKEWIRQVKSMGHLPAIISDGRTVTQRNKLKGLGIETLIAPEDILISSEQGEDKHNPLMFRRLMDLHPEEDRFVYVGDNTSKDFYWPKRLGWKTVGILDRRGTNIHPQRLDVDQAYLPDIWK